MAGVREMRIHVNGGGLRGGDVPISGYKHAFTVVLGAALAMGRRVALSNVPRTIETEVLSRIVSDLGVARSISYGRWELDGTSLHQGPLPSELSQRIHGSLYLAPALLARFGQVDFPGAGGDRIGSPESGGARPLDQVCAVMERFGARVQRGGDDSFRAAADRGLRSCEIDILDFSTDPVRLRGPRASSATKTALILAAVAEGPTTIRNPVETDVTRELCAFLQACGCLVERDPDAWRVEPAVNAEPVTHHLISDSTEIVTFIACAARLTVPLRLTGITADRTRAAIVEELVCLEAMGVSVAWEADSLHVIPPDRLGPATIEIECKGFSTDSSPFFALMLLGANGESQIADHVWTSRLDHVRLLIALGGRLRVDGNRVHLSPSTLRAPSGPLVPADSRAAAVALIGALGVAGSTTIIDHEHLDRSYEHLVEKLRDVGAMIEPVNDRPHLEAAAPSLSRG
jgi:UDP-N-acetylglucosamine 1-carboxyvinyltransferase